MKLNQGTRQVSLDGGSDDGQGLGSLGVELPDTGDDPETALIKSRSRQSIERLLAALPPELREAIVLRELEELSYKEISQITETPIGTVMSRLWRARRLLAETVTREVGQ
jgi:RNA polymerase sigma-70 factor (ECF subfamily)